MRLLDNSELKFFEDCPAELFDPLRQKVLDLSDGFWADFAYNRDRSNVLFLYNGDAKIHDDGSTSIDYGSHVPDPANVRTFAAWHDTSWRSLIEPIIAWICQQNQCSAGGVVNKLLLSRVIPGGYIEPHWDEEPTQAVSKRMHVVVTSNDRSEFTVNGKTWFLHPGQAFELNNMYDHSVHNGGSKDRVHLMIDYYHPDHIKELFYGRYARDHAESDIEVIFTNRLKDALGYYDQKRQARLQADENAVVPLHLRQ